MATCNVCDSKLSAVVLKIDKPDRFEAHICATGELKYECRQWMHCQECEAAVNVTSKDIRRALDAIADSYYEIDFGNIDLKERQRKILALDPKNSDNHNRVQRINDLFNEHSKNWALGERIRGLDFGSGLGVFPVALMRLATRLGKPLDLHLVESDPRALEVLREIPQVQIHPGLYDESDHNQYDVIFMNKVLEHLGSPVGWVRLLARRLSADGLFYVEVPSVRCLSGNPDSGELGSLHFNLYSLKTLSFIASVCGLNMVAAEEVDDPSGKKTCYALYRKSVAG